MRGAAIQTHLPAYHTCVADDFDQEYARVQYLYSQRALPATQEMAMRYFARFGLRRVRRDDWSRAAPRACRRDVLIKPPGAAIN